jgi:predicted lipoprotein with Yx(FWY)xxD motif
LALTACGDDQPQALPSAPASAAPTSAAANAGDPAPSSPAQATNPNGGYWPAAINVADSTKLGKVVVDGTGFTLYRFDKDSANPPTSACFDACALKWPPVLTRNKIVFHGVDESLLGAIKRPDGTFQVTLAGHPMYRFSGDSKPGDINGEAVQGTWFSFAPTGKKANGDN